MVYDIVELVNGVDGILVAECRKRIFIPIINFIIKNKVDRFKVRGLLIYIPTEWYHPEICVFRDVSATDNIMCK